MKDVWSQKQCKILQRLLSRFKTFKATPVISRLREFETTHDEFARVNLVGLAPESVSTAAVDDDEKRRDENEGEELEAASDSENNETAKLASLSSNLASQCIQTAFFLECEEAG